MTKQQSATFRSARPSPPYWAVRFDVAHSPAPGQFVLADLGGPLREALFPAALDADGFVTLVAPGHPVTRLLPGATVDFIGPTGRGFRLGQAQRLLLIAEAAHFPILMPLLNAAPAVALVIEAATRTQLPSLDHIPPAVELTLVTLDGSMGYIGPLESQEAGPAGLERAGPVVLDLIAWADRIALACTQTRYPALAALIRDTRLRLTADFAQAWVNVAMPCGVGACDICRIATRRGEKRVCTDGPVFDLMALG